MGAAERDVSELKEYIKKRLEQRLQLERQRGGAQE